MQLIAVEDIGAFAALAFAQPKTYLGQALEIAGDALNFRQIHTTLRQATGKPQPYLRVPATLAMGATGEIGKMFRWFRDAGYQADLARMAQLHPARLSFAAWAQQAAAAPASA